MGRIREFHAAAYDWKPGLSPERIYDATASGGYLLRTRIRAAIELLDQLYQYGEAGDAKIGELTRESLQEEPDDTPELPELEP